MITTAYRPRNPGRDYYGRGVYLITLVVSNREPLLSKFVTVLGHEKIALTTLGEAVLHAWLQTPTIQASHSNHVAGVPADSSYSRFHNMNTLAAEICSFSGEARIIHG